MKALVYTKPYQVVFREEPDPVPGPGESLVRVAAAGICGSDLHAYYGHDARRVPPLILGHEAVGTVVSGEMEGERVIINPLITCGKCAYCLEGRSNLCAQRELIGMRRAGAFAEWVSIPPGNLIPLPEDLDWVPAALTEPLATIVHSLNLAKKSWPRPLSESKCLVIGGGAIGLLTVLLLQAEGCRDILLSEINPLRRDSAKRWLACEGFDPLNDPALPNDQFDLVVDAVGGAKTRQQAMASIKPGGVILHIGLMDSEGGLDTRKLTLSEITLIGVYTYTPEDLRTALAGIHSGVLGNLAWVQTGSLDDGPMAFKVLSSGETPAAKFVLLP